MRLYEIEFVYFANGVATFTTDKDLGEIIQKGKDNGWTELSVNHVIYLDDLSLDVVLSDELPIADNSGKTERILITKGREK